MDGIPPALDTDVEDVAWALQTADALWKRAERGDAIVWLRRAAQAAGEANDDDRALTLARGAAELTEAMTTAKELPPASESVPISLGEELPTDPEELDRGTEAADETPVGVILSQPPISMRAVPTAAESHAGMLDPWSEPASQKAPPRPPPRTKVVLKPEFEEEEVVTSARQPARRPPPVPSKSPPAKPVSVPAAAAAEPFPGDEAETAPRPATEAPALAPAPDPPLVLAGVEAFGDLPEDACASFASAADVKVLKRGESVTPFALAYVVEGEVDVCPDGCAARASNLRTGAVLRARGTLDRSASLRLVCTSPFARIATWNDAQVTHAFGTCPWVEEDLRAAGDHVQALAGLVGGPLGEASYNEVRSELASRLSLRVLAPGETLLHEGDAIPGLLVLGGGEIELSPSCGPRPGRARDVPSVDALAHPKIGGFIFPRETLSAERAPAAAVAGKDGAIVLCADRAVTQELVVTQPLLLELLAGS